MREKGLHCIPASVQHDRLHLVSHGVRLRNALLCMSEGVCTKSERKLLTTISSLCAFAADTAGVWLSACHGQFLLQPHAKLCV